MIEMIYLIEKGRIAAESFTHLVSLPEGARGLFLEVPRDMRISRSLARVGANTVPDMPDRIIAATALYLGVPVISKDSKIHLSGLTTIW